MDHFEYRNGELHAEDVPLRRIAAAVGTPFFCYSTATLERHYRVFEDAVSGLDSTVCYAIKANSNIAVVATLAGLGAGADVVSIGELRRALAAGVPAGRIVFSGVGKTVDEIAEALSSGVLRINVESEPELEMLSETASSLGIEAALAVRVNPDVDALTHEKITTGKAENKFGIDIAVARDVYRRAASLPGVRVVGVAVHIGSQLTDLAPYREAYSRLVEFVETLRQDGHAIEELDMGGGLGITYTDEQAPSPKEYGDMTTAIVGPLNCRVTFEPGRVIAGNAGVLVTRVIAVKEGASRRFCIVDGAMNDLIRPTLYNADHQIVPLREAAANTELSEMDVVGPICESGDFLARSRALAPVRSGDLLAVRTAGAYAAVMSSAYNSRPLAPEVMVRGGEFAVVRERIGVDEMMAHESLPGWLGPEAAAARGAGE